MTPFCLLFAACASLGGETIVAGEAPAALSRYAGSHDSEALLSEPAVRDELAVLAGDRLPRLLRALDVRGAIDLSGAFLSLAGNAPHRGGEEEAVVCVGVRRLEVHAAILDQRTVTVFTRESRYGFLPQCIKDWITLANSGHRDRLEQPPNVELATSP